jgi:polar amino acid transport system permease protein
MGRRTGWIAFASTLATFGLLGWLLVNAPNWPAVQRSFFNGDEFGDALPAVAWAFRINIEMFLIAEVLTLTFGLGIAILRSLPGPVFFPIRLLAIAYVDVFRAVPGILVIFYLGLGVPSLRIPGLPNDPFVWGIIVLTLIYSAYVSEVYRAGIESIHPSQEAAARSLGLTRAQVILP